LGHFTVRLAAGFEFHFLPGTGARTEKQDPSDLAVHTDHVKALIEVIRLRLRPLASCPLFSLELATSPGLNDLYLIIHDFSRRRPQPP
jgi:hypothetical protein